MDWKAVQFDWNRARAFLVAAEEGSLSAAARSLEITQPTLSRQVAALEEELNIVLFERFSGGLSLTPSGLELLNHVRAMGDAASQFSLTANGQSLALEGNICIAASEIDATFRLPAIIATLRELEPGIEIDVVVSNAASDLKRREADIAIRSFQPPQPDLIARKIRDINIWPYVSHDYFSSKNLQENPSDLSGVSFAGFDHSSMIIDALNAVGIAATQEHFPITCPFQLLQWELAKAGTAMAIFPEDIGDAEPRLRKAYEASGPLLSIPMWLVCHRELRTSRRVRRVFDLLAQGLGAPSIAPL
jgi:DNA-binding transcriptional LysR family regulator